MLNKKNAPVFSLITLLPIKVSLLHLIFGTFGSICVLCLLAMLPVEYESYNFSLLEKCNGALR